MKRIKVELYARLGFKLCGQTAIRCNGQTAVCTNVYLHNQLNPHSIAQSIE